jgi:uncharacterized membrane protein
MNFQFSIGAALKRAWNIYKKHFWFFLGLSFVMLVLNFSTRGKHSLIIEAVIVAAVIIWNYVWLSVSLAAIDGKEHLLRFDTIKSHFPGFRAIAKYLIVSVAAALVILAGLVLLVVPGIYFLVRLSFSKLAAIDRKGSVKQALRYSWYLVKKDVFWTVFLTVIVSIALMLIGVVTVIGLVIAYPLVSMLVAQLYRALEKRADVAVIEQPLEIEA